MATTSSEVECQRQVRFYQSKFPTVPTMTSLELQERRRSNEYSSNGAKTIILVDVRTEKERQVSIIPGAIPLEELHLETPIDDSISIVTYCTIGYRSGLEGQRLLETYPSLRVYSLDGILAYSHTDASLVDPLTGESTRQVHAFAKAWKKCCNPEYKIHYYGSSGLLGRLMQVAGLIILRGAQHAAYLLSSCYCPRRRRE